MRISRQTTKCVRCGKPAQWWSGWVQRGRAHILAGWCSKRCLTTWTHCFGRWTPAMGAARAD